MEAEDNMNSQKESYGDLQAAGTGVQLEHMFIRGFWSRGPT